MHDADKENVNSVAEWLLEEFKCDSTWFAAAWADIYRRMQEIERSPSEDSKL